jgi:hypothetical protein
MAELFANDAYTTLDGDIDDNDTTLVVADGVLFPAEGDFRIRIDDEFMLVTGVSGTTWTIERAVEGMGVAVTGTAASHVDGAEIRQVVTRDALTSGLGGGGSSYPLDIEPENTHAKSDEFNEDGVLDAKWTSGFKATTKTVAHSWLTITPNGSGFAHKIYQVAPTGDFAISLKSSWPSGIPLTDTRPGLFVAKTAQTKALVGGLGISGGPSKAMWIEHSNYSEVADWGAYNGGFSGNLGGTYAGGPIWHRMRWVSASSTVFIDWSADGVTWYAGSSRASWSQPDRIGIVIENNSGNTSVNDSYNIDWFRVSE